MGLSYHFKFTAPGSTSAEELENFLRKVEIKAKKLGFAPTMVLNANFDTPERRRFARRLTRGHILENDQLKGMDGLADAQVWEQNSSEGWCRIIPERAVVLVVTDQQGCETAFGFLRYPSVIRMSGGAEALNTGAGDRWLFEDFVDSPDPRFRQLVRAFAEAGYVESELDEYAEVAA